MLNILLYSQILILVCRLDCSKHYIASARELLFQSIKVANDRLIRDAIAENQFSMGAINCPDRILDRTMSASSDRQDCLVELKQQLDRWLNSLDLARSVIN